MAGPDRGNTPVVVVVVAIVGLLATIGASALGGYWANRSVERQLESERSTAIQDQRREVYVDYLASTLRLCDAWGQVSIDLDQDPTAAGNQRAPADVLQRDKDKLDAAALDLLNQHGRVVLIAGPDLTQAVTDFTEALVPDDSVGIPLVCSSGDLDPYVRFRDAFVKGAEPDLE